MVRATHTYLKTHALGGDVLSCSLSDESARLRERAMAARTGRAAKTLFKQGALRGTLIALRKGAALSPHQVEGEISIHAVRGRVRVSAHGGVATLGAGGVLVLARGVTHSAQALSDCVLLITVAMP